MTTGLLDLTDSEPGGPRLEGVGVLRRGVARLLDIGVFQLASLVGGAFALIGVLVLEVVYGPVVWAAVETVTEAEGGTARVWDLLLGATGLVVMHTISEGLHGSTIGKRLLGITVVTEGGTPAGMMAALKRSLGFLVDQFAFGLVGAYFIHNDPLGQRVGDSWAETIVVRRGDVPAEAHRSTGRFVLATLAALTAVALVSFFTFTARIALVTRAASADRVEILRVAPVSPELLRPGKPAAFVVRVRHDLRSVPRGRLLLYLPGELELEPVGERTHIIRGESTTTMRVTLAIPEEQVAPGSRAIVLGVGLLPAPNLESMSAYGEYYLELVPCDRSQPDVLCIGSASGH